MVVGGGCWWWWVLFKTTLVFGLRLSQAEQNYSVILTKMKSGVYTLYLIIGATPSPPGYGLSFYFDPLLSVCHLHMLQGFPLRSVEVKAWSELGQAQFKLKVMNKVAVEVFYN